MVPARAFAAEAPLSGGILPEQIQGEAVEGFDHPDGLKALPAVPVGELDQLDAQKVTADFDPPQSQIVNAQFTPPHRAGKKPVVVKRNQLARLSGKQPS